MHYTDLIKRAWQITWRYKVLWIFGILLALARVAAAPAAAAVQAGAVAAPSRPCPAYSTSTRA